MRVSVNDADFVVLVDNAEIKGVTFPETIYVAPYRNRPPTLLRIGLRHNVQLGRGEESRGDISLLHYDRIVGIERKRGTNELISDVNRREGGTNKLERQIRALSKNVKHPYLLLDSPLTECRLSGRHAMGFVDAAALRAIHYTFKLCHEHNVGIIGPISGRGPRTRVILGNWLLQLMLSHVMK